MGETAKSSVSERTSTGIIRRWWFTTLSEKKFVNSEGGLNWLAHADRAVASPL